MILFCLDLLIFLTIPIMTHKTMIITIKRNTVTVGIIITATLKLETAARKQNLCMGVNTCTHIGCKLSVTYTTSLS